MAVVTCPSCGVRFHLKLADNAKTRGSEVSLCLECWKALMDLKAYSDHFSRIAEVTIRGEGQDQSLQAKSGMGIVEMSRSMDGLWLKYWNEGADTLVREEVVFSRSDVIRKAGDWLFRGAT